MMLGVKEALLNSWVEYDVGSVGSLKYRVSLGNFSRKNSCQFILDSAETYKTWNTAVWLSKNYSILWDISDL